MRLTASTTVIEHKGRAYDAVQISCEAPDFVCYVLYDADGHQPDIASIIGDRPVFQLWRIGDDLRTRKLAGAEYDVDDECESIIAGRWRFVAPSAAPVDAPALSPESLKQRARAVLDARREWDRQRSAGAEDYDARAMAKAGKLIADEGPAVVALLLAEVEQLTAPCDADGLVEACNVLDEYAQSLHGDDYPGYCRVFDVANRLRALADRMKSAGR